YFDGANIIDALGDSPLVHASGVAGKHAGIAQRKKRNSARWPNTQQVHPPQIDGAAIFIVANQQVTSIANNNTRTALIGCGSKLTAAVKQEQLLERPVGAVR